MKYLTFLLTALLFISCGDNSGGNNDLTDDERKYLDSLRRADSLIITPQTDTLGTDNIEAIGKRKGVDQTQAKSIVYYQLVKRTFKYKL